MIEPNPNRQPNTQMLTNTTTTVLSPDESRVEEITTEILQQKQQTVQSVIQIGKLLEEAKGRLKKDGKWLKWLATRVDISERNAQRYMQLARAFPDPTPMSDLGMTKALALLNLPEGQRDDFINEPHNVNGKQKNIREMSVREVRRAVYAQLKPTSETDNTDNAIEDADVVAEGPDATEVTAGANKMVAPFPKLKTIFNDRDTRTRPSDRENLKALSDSPNLNVLTTDLESAQKHMDCILSILGSQTERVDLQDKLTDGLRYLHETVLKCLNLAKVELPNDVGGIDHVNQ